MVLWITPNQANLLKFSRNFPTYFRQPIFFYLSRLKILGISFAFPLPPLHITGNPGQYPSLSDLYCYIPNTQNQKSSIVAQPFRSCAYGNMFFVLPVKSALLNFIVLIWNRTTARCLAVSFIVDSTSAVSFVNRKPKIKFICRSNQISYGILLQLFI